MFLDASEDDFNNSSLSLRRRTPKILSLPDNILTLNIEEEPWGATSWPQFPQQLALGSLPTGDLYLLEYYQYALAPRCMLANTSNSYVNVGLRMALSQSGGPLLNMLLAVSANQLRLLGHNEYNVTTWRYRSLALTGLRELLQRHANGKNVEWEFILAMSVMMAFFEVSVSAPRQPSMALCFLLNSDPSADSNRYRPIALTPGFHTVNVPNIS